MLKPSSEYIFNVALIGPNDKLNEKFLEMMADRHANVDGVYFHVGKVENVAVINFWQPHFDAESKQLIDLTYKTANAVIIVLPRPNKKTEEKYRKKVFESKKEILITTFIMKQDTELIQEAKDMLKKLTFSMILKAEASKQKTIDMKTTEKQLALDEKAGQPIYFVDKTGIITTINTKGSIPLYGEKTKESNKKKK